MFQLEHLRLPVTLANEDKPLQLSWEPIILQLIQTIIIKAEVVSGTAVYL